MIKTFTGPMFSGKTKRMIQVYNSIYNKEHIKIFKPFTDTRDFSAIKSRDIKNEIKAICIEQFEDIPKYINEETRTIFIDEAQFIKGNVNILSYLSIMNDIDFYIDGLNMTSEQQPFLNLPYLLAISDEIEIVKASCFDCGRPASYTYSVDKNKQEVKVGNDGYMPLCSRCLLKRRGEEETKKLLLMRKNQLID